MVSPSNNSTRTQKGEPKPANAPADPAKPTAGEEALYHQTDRLLQTPIDPQSIEELERKRIELNQSAEFLREQAK
jgi:hypothetical protein